jgi:hypothetical protein
MGKNKNDDKKNDKNDGFKKFFDNKNDDKKNDDKKNDNYGFKKLDNKNDNKKNDKNDKNDELKKLYDDLVASRNREEEAADQLTEAEQNYYNYKNGSNGYEQHKNIQDKIKSLSIQKNASVRMTPAEYRNIELQALYDAMIESKDNEINSAELVEDSTRRYYNFKDGPDGYNDYMLIQYQKDAVEMKKTMLAKHEEQMSIMNESILYSESQEMYLKNLSDVTSTLAKKIKELIGEVRKDSVNTNNRKTYYTELAEKHLSSWTTTCNFILLAFVFSLAYEYRNVINQPIIWGTLLTILIFIFSLRYIISLLSKIPTSLSIYTEWGYDPNESKIFWLLFIPFTLLLIYILIHIFQ